MLWGFDVTPILEVANKVKGLPIGDGLHVGSKVSRPGWRTRYAESVVSVAGLE
jgi:hypothetical protein